jgi:hypothetical protein
MLFFVMMLCWGHRAGGSLGSDVCGRRRLRVMVGCALTCLTYFSAAHYGHTLLPRGLPAR